METAIVAIILATAALVVGRRVVRTFRSGTAPRSSGSCGGGCCGCGSDSSGERLVQLRRRPGAAQLGAVPGKVRR